jgi:hypothetical protein
MQYHYTADTLKEAIKALEVRQEEDEKQLRAELFNVYENLKPINIIKNIVRDAANTDSLKHDIINTVTSLVSGFISKKIIIGRSNNPLVRLAGMGVQLGVTTLISAKYHDLKYRIWQFFSSIKENENEED